MLNTLSHIEKALALAGRMSPMDHSEKQSNDRLLFWGTVILGTLSSGLMLTGVGLYVAKTYEPYLALVIVGLLTLFLLLSVAAAYQFIRYCKNKHAQQAYKKFETQIKQYLSDAGESADDTFKENVGLIAVMVTVMGYLVAKKI